MSDSALQESAAEAAVRDLIADAINADTAEKEENAIATLVAILERAAAGPWQTGEPPREGRYLIEYRQGRIQRVFIGDWCNGWNAMGDDTEVLRWAEIMERR